MTRPRIIILTPRPTMEEVIAWSGITPKELREVEESLAPMLAEWKREDAESETKTAAPRRAKQDEHGWIEPITALPRVITDEEIRAVEDSLAPMLEEWRWEDERQEEAKAPRQTKACVPTIVWPPERGACGGGNEAVKKAAKRK